MERKLADRRSNFKKNFEDPRRKREDLQLQIRKTHREQNLAKKRAEALDSQDGSLAGNAGMFSGMGGASVADGSMAPGMAGQQGQENVFKFEHLPQMMSMLSSGDPEQEFEATEQFRRALSIESRPPIQEVIEAGAVPLFVQFLRRSDQPRMQFEAAWALTNIASGTQEQTQVVIEHGAVPIFVELLSSPTEDVREQAVWALGNIAGDSPQCRDLVLQAGVLSPLLAQLNDSEAKFTMQRNATWTLSNLCRGKPQPPFEWVQPALTTLAKLIYSTDTEVLTDACWALSYISDGPNERIEAVIEAGVSRRLVELLGHKSTLVQTPALRTVGNIVTGDDRQTEVVILCGAVPALLMLLSSPKKAIRKEACWTISNITAGNRDQIQQVIDAGLIHPLIELLSTADFDVRKEAAWAISNAASGGSNAQVEALVECGCIRPLCSLLAVQDSKIVSVALEALENILRVGKMKKEQQQLAENPFCELIEQADGITVIEKLQDAANQDIYEKAWRIICNYFSFEEADVDDVDVDASAGAGMADAGQVNAFGAAPPQGGFNFGQ
ncbi:mgc78841 protein, related [Neospora caninum Liverpool]|uniref:Importin subunit alpha n=2 Tax=Sarcocystidae TaxID=5809 RepID=F0V940_NEOCL|nr:mgc78841 protein, related [Neospora caninum Liverpool]CBZ50265.1 mgc78841 protein, related [Neospora caninum Liverpool]CEL64869.1 TPA: MGC78841 protein, related [Neospora caninum Liverpool]|eukprot:XP_003880299.1 mgc78841 protein, related [Neospora caninum Liverpool]